VGGWKGQGGRGGTARARCPAGKRGDLSMPHKAWWCTGKKPERVGRQATKGKVLKFRYRINRRLLGEKKMLAEAPDPYLY